MPHLLDLPVELLTLVLEEIGGRELRRGKDAAGRLLVCRAWYGVALPMFLSGLETSTISLYGRSIDEEVGAKYGSPSLRRLMHKNMRALRIHLSGHWWDNENTYQDEINRMINNPPTVLPIIDVKSQNGMQKLENWRDQQLNPFFDGLFRDLRYCTALEELVFVTRKEDPIGGPEWDYVFPSTILSMVVNLPLLHDLTSLTLDLAGSDFVDSAHSDIHICESLAKVVPRIENVRLRMQTICPAVLTLPASLCPSDIRLRTFVLKLQFPTLEDGFCYKDSHLCHTEHEVHRPLARYEMDGTNFVRQLRNLAGSEDVLTGFWMCESADYGLDVGTTNVLTGKYSESWYEDETPWVQR